MLSEYGLDDSLDLVAIYHIIINTVPTRLKHFVLYLHSYCIAIHCIKGRITESPQHSKT